MLVRPIVEFGSRNVILCLFRARAALRSIRALMSCFRSLSKWPSAFKASMASLVKTSRYSLCKFPRISSIQHLASPRYQNWRARRNHKKHKRHSYVPLVLLVVSVPLRCFSYILQRLPGFLFFDLRDIADRDNACEAFVLTEKKHAANSFVPHLLRDIFSVVAFETPVDILGHYITGL